jgi:hypothetical protein
MSTSAPVLEHADAEPDELVRRLRSLRWPAPEADLRERCLDVILTRQASDPAYPEAPDAQAAVPRKRRFGAERGERYEATRWSAPRCVGLQAPARQPRFAAVL